MSNKEEWKGISFELGLAVEHETEGIYNQGLKDCVWPPKNLGVPA